MNDDCENIDFDALEFEDLGPDAKQLKHFELFAHPSHYTQPILKSSRFARSPSHVALFVSDPLHPTPTIICPHPSVNTCDPPPLVYAERSGTNDINDAYIDLTTCDGTRSICPIIPDASTKREKIMQHNASMLLPLSIELELHALNLNIWRATCDINTNSNTGNFIH